MQRPWLNRLKSMIQSRQMQRLFLGLMLLVLAVDSSRILRGPLPFRSRSDFEDYFEASRRLNADEDLYRKDAMQNIIEKSADFPEMKPEEILRLLIESKGIGAYLYPPFFAFLLTPLHRLDYHTAAVIYQTISLAFLIALLYLLEMQRRADGSPYEYAVVLATFLYFPFLDDNASNGNVGFLLLFLCGAGLLWSYREGLLSFLGGFFIGLAAVIKIIPGFLSGVLFAGRRYVALSGFFCGIIFAVFLPGLSGWQKNLDRHEQWYSFLIRTYEKNLVVRPYANNQTVSAALSKLLIPESDRKQKKYGLPLVRLSIDELPYLSISIRWINLALVGSLGLLLLFTAWRRPLNPRSDPVFFTGIVSLTMLTALVSSGVSWYHTYSLLLIPLTLRLSAGPLPSSITEEWIAHFATAVLAIFLAILPFPWFEALSLYSLYTWVVLLCIVLFHRMAWKGLMEGRPGKGGMT